MLLADARGLSKLLSDLSGRIIRFAPVTKAPAGKIPAVYGSYECLPSGNLFVMQVDAALLGLLAGSLLGLPDDVATQRAVQATDDEPLRDAMHEILNITSSALSTDERVVLRRMGRSADAFPEPEASTIRLPDSKLCFNVFIAEKLVGGVALLS